MGVTKGDSHITDNKAIRIIEDLYDDEHCTPYQIKPDYGLDLRIELVRDKKHTGITAFLQVKGKSRLSLGKKKKVPAFISQDLEIEHLNNYMGLLEPVFLVVVDTQRREGYWVFLQKYLDSDRSDWRSRSPVNRGKKPTKAIRVPTSNRLTDSSAFRKAIQDARGYMTRRAIREGIEHGQSSLGQLDPRFDVRMVVSDKGDQFHIRAIEDVRVDVTFSDDFFRSGKLHDLVGRGIPVRISPGDVKMEGSLLLETVLNEAANSGGILSLTHRREGYVRMVHVDESGKEVGRCDFMQCHYEGGAKECRVRAELPYGLFSVQCGSTAEHPDHDKLTVNYSLKSWYGKTLLNLPYFDCIAGLFGDVDENDSLLVEFYIDGVMRSSGRIRWGQTRIQQVGGWVDLIKKARWIARHYGQDRVLPETIDDHTENQILAIYELDHGGELRHGMRDADVQCMVSKDMAERFFLAEGEEPLLGRISHEKAVEMPFLGQEINIGRVRMLVTKMAMETSRSSIRDQFAAGAAEASIRFVGTDESELIYLGRNDGRINEDEESTWESI